MIKKALTKDAKELFNLERKVFEGDSFALGLSSFYYHIKKSELYMFESDKKLIGYILWLKRKKHYRLYSLCVDTEFRSQGIAKQLLEYSFKKLKAEYFSLEVKVTNVGAIKLYEKFGFEIKKTLPNYYKKNEDGYLMIKR